MNAYNTENTRRATRRMPCGTTTDCHPSYTADDIKYSTATWDPCDRKAAVALHERYNAAKLACNDRRQSSTSVLSTGGWCLSAPVTKTHGHHSGGTVNLANNQTHALPKGHYAADAVVVAVIAALLQNQIPSLAMDRPQSINDFGAGVGQYGHALRAVNNSIDWQGYDGAGNVEMYTKGFVRFFDLTLPLSLPRADWMLSLEVGEHMPSTWEMMYFRNLHAHQCRGIIGSWAKLGQVGTGHVNNHAREYIMSRFAQLGYTSHAELQGLLLERPSRFETLPGLPVISQLRNNLFAVVRKNATCRPSTMRMRVRA